MGGMNRRIALGIEELFNVATHGFGLAASLAAVPLLIVLAARGGDAWTIAGVAVFGATLVAAYGASTMYHSCARGPRRDLWRRMDQAAVYLLIAGTYTPFSLGPLRGPLGWALLGVVWSAALLAAGIKLWRRTDCPRVETATYLAMGWLIVVVIEPLLQRIGWSGLAWLVAGGVTYTIGVGFLVCQSRMRWGHCAWHVFVLIGSACHAIAVLNYGIVSRV